MIRACFFAFIIGDVDGKREQAVWRVLFLKREEDKLLEDQVLII